MSLHCTTPFPGPSIAISSTVLNPADRCRPPPPASQSLASQRPPAACCCPGPAPRTAILPIPQHRSPAQCSRRAGAPCSPSGGPGAPLARQQRARSARRQQVRAAHRPRALGRAAPPAGSSGGRRRRRSGGRFRQCCPMLSASWRSQVHPCKLCASPRLSPCIPPAPCRRRAAEQSGGGGGRQEQALQDPGRGAGAAHIRWALCRARRCCRRLHGVGWAAPVAASRPCGLPAGKQQCGGAASVTDACSPAPHVADALTLPPAPFRPPPCLQRKCGRRRSRWACAASGSPS